MDFDFEFEIPKLILNKNWILKLDLDPFWHFKIQTEFWTGSRVFFKGFFAKWWILIWNPKIDFEIRIKIEFWKGSGSEVLKKIGSGSRFEGNWFKKWESNPEYGFLKNLKNGKSPKFIIKLGFWILDLGSNSENGIESWILNQNPRSENWISDVRWIWVQKLIELNFWTDQKVDPDWNGSKMA